MYLLDTNVVSESHKQTHGRTGAAAMNPRVRAWMESVAPSSLFLSVISVLELELGYHLLARRDRRQAEVLFSWIRNRVLPSFADRILSVDLQMAQRCALLHVPDPLDDRDALIAATALVHGFTVVTRNVRDFESTGVALLNPWEA
jgi:toxin FitB